MPAACGGMMIIKDWNGKQQSLPISSFRDVPRNRQLALSVESGYELSRNGGRGLPCAFFNNTSVPFNEILPFIGRFCCTAVQETVDDELVLLVACGCERTL